MSEGKAKIKKVGYYLIEENGKLYREHIDGRVETSVEKEQEEDERNKRFIEFCELSLARYENNNWGIGDVPKDADAYIQLELFYKRSRENIHNSYSKAKDKEGSLKCLL